MTIEQLEQMQKYYLSDDILQADDLEYVLANAVPLKMGHGHVGSEMSSIGTEYDRLPQASGTDSHVLLIKAWRT